MTTLRDQLAETIHHARMHHTGDPCAGGPFDRDTDIADAVLALFEVATEHRVNVVHPLVTGQWLGEPFDPTAAVDVLPASWTIGTIERRYVLTTKAEAVEEASRP